MSLLGDCNYRDPIGPLGVPVADQKSGVEGHWPEVEGHWPEDNWPEDKGRRAAVGFLPAAPEQWGSSNQVLCAQKSDDL